MEDLHQRRLKTLKRGHFLSLILENEGCATATDVVCSFLFFNFRNIFGWIWFDIKNTINNYVKVLVSFNPNFVCFFI